MRTREKSDSISEAILNKNTDKIYNIKCDETLFESIHVIFSDRIKIEIKISISDCLTDDINSTRENPNNATKLYEAIGPHDEFKLLFDELKLCTNYSKKEISNILRHHAICESSILLPVFEIIIPKNKIN